MKSNKKLSLILSMMLIGSSAMALESIPEEIKQDYLKKVKEMKLPAVRDDYQITEPLYSMVHAKIGD